MPLVFELVEPGTTLVAELQATTYFLDSKLSKLSRLDAQIYFFKSINTERNTTFQLSRMGSSYDEFVHITTDPAASPYRGGGAPVADEWLRNADGKRILSVAPIYRALRAKYPKHHITVNLARTCNLLAFGDFSDDITYFPHGDPGDALLQHEFIPPARRYNDENGGTFADKVQFGIYDYVYKGDSFLLYVVESQDGPYSIVTYHFLLVEDLTMDSRAAAQKKADNLIAAASRWQMELNGEVLVFDQGFWQPNKELWENVQKANWEDVILEKERKAAIIEDVIGFFDAEARYAEFGVPWKVGTCIVLR